MLCQLQSNVRIVFVTNTHVRITATNWLQPSQFSTNIRFSFLRIAQKCMLLCLSLLFLIPYYRITSYFPSFYFSGRFLLLTKFSLFHPFSFIVFHHADIIFPLRLSCSFRLFVFRISISCNSLWNRLVTFVSSGVLQTYRCVNVGYSFNS